MIYTYWYYNNICIQQQMYYQNLTWQNPEQLFVAQELINKVKSKCCGIKDLCKD